MILRVDHDRRKSGIAKARQHVLLVEDPHFQGRPLAAVKDEVCEDLLAAVAGRVEQDAAPVGLHDPEIRELGEMLDRRGNVEIRNREDA
ncbi:MAG: hypothetical protein ACXWBL_14250, partial [Usitatibacter sp.]